MAYDKTGPGPGQSMGDYGVPGGGPDVRPGNYDGDGDADSENAGSLGGGSDVMPSAGSSTNAQPRHPSER